MSLGTLRSRNSVLRRWLAAGAVCLGTAVPAAAQLPGGYPISVFESAAPVNADPPSNLPPLLPVPPANPPAAPGPRGPDCDYDHGRLYLPERAPDAAKLPPCPCRPLGRTWVIPTLELGWSRAPSLPAVGDVSSRFRAGFGLAAGTWLDRCQNRGIDASLYYLGNDHADAALGPLPLPPGLPFAGPLSGAVGLTTRYATADVNYRQTLYCETNARLDTLVGYRYAHVGEQADFAGPLPGAGGFRGSASAANHFHGGQIGLAGEYRVDDWYVGLVPKIAFGRVFTRSDLDARAVVPGLGLPPGIGLSRDDGRFAVMPTLAVTVGRQLGDHGRVFVGYNFQYLSRVTRVGDVLTSPAAPGTSDLWVQSVSLGTEWRY